MIGFGGELNQSDCLYAGQKGMEGMESAEDTEGMEGTEGFWLLLATTF